MSATSQEQPELATPRDAGQKIAEAYGQIPKSKAIKVAARLLVAATVLAGGAAAIRSGTEAGKGSETHPDRGSVSVANFAQKERASLDGLAATVSDAVERSTLQNPQADQVSADFGLPDGRAVHATMANGQESVVVESTTHNDSTKADETVSVTIAGPAAGSELTPDAIPSYLKSSTTHIVTLSAETTERPATEAAADGTPPDINTGFNDSKYTAEVTGYNGNDVEVDVTATGDYTGKGVAEAESVIQRVVGGQPVHS